MSKKKRFRTLLAALILALALQPVADWGAPRKAEAAGLKAWQPIGNPVTQSSVYNSELVFGGGSLWMGWNVGTQLHVSRWNGSDWVNESTGSYAVDGAQFFDLAIAPDGTPYAVYSASNQPFAVARENGDKTWSAVGDPATAFASSYQPKIAVGSSGGVYVIAIDKVNDLATAGVLEGSIWQQEIVSGGAAYMPAIAVDASDKPVASYLDEASGYYNPIVKSRGQNGIWDHYGGVGGSGSWPVLQAASDGSLYLAYTSGNGSNNAVHVWRRDTSGGWSEIGNAPGYYGSMAIDPTDGHPVISYTDSYDPGGMLHAAKWDGAGWNEIGSLGIRDYTWYRSTSVAVGDDGTTYISYTDPSNGIHVLGYVLQTAPPQLLGTLPANDEQGFAFDGKLQLTFDGPVTGVAGKKISVCDTATSICDEIDAGGSRVASGGATVEISPDGQWPDGATLSVSIEAGAFADGNGNPYAGLSGGQWQFAVRANPPQLEQTEPMGTIEANRPEYRVKFDREMVPNGGYMTVYRASDDREIDRIPVTADRATAQNDGWLAFSGDADLPQDGASYYMLIDQDAFKDQAGRTFEGLADKTAWTFSTLDENALQAVSKVPDNGSEGVANVESLQLTFNEEITAVAGKKINVFVNNGDVPFAEIDASAVTVEGTKATIPLTERLPAGSIVAVFVDRGAFKDAAGNPFAGISSNQDWQFRTASSPSAPILDEVQAGDGQATVSFTPGDDGGRPIDRYIVTVTIPGENDRVLKTVEGDSSPIVVPGLVNGTGYSFKVQAENEVGISDYSNASSEAVPSARPDAPTVTANPVDGGAEVTVLPSADNGAAVSRYRVTAYDEQGNPLKSVEADADAGASKTILVDGLTNGTAYRFGAWTLNANGWSDESERSDPVVPSGKPQPPQQAVATAGFESVTLTFEPPAGDEGSPITTYRVRLLKDGVEADAREVSPDQRSFTWNDLEKGASYVLEVAAGNANGLSEYASASAVPYGAPDAPTGVTAAAGDGTATVRFTPGPLYGGTQVAFEVVAWDDADPLPAATGISSPIAYDGLTNGRSYTFTVAAVTEYGRSSPSERSVAVVPTATNNGGGSPGTGGGTGGGGSSTPGTGGGTGGGGSSPSTGGGTSGGGTGSAGGTGGTGDAGSQPPSPGTTPSGPLQDKGIAYIGGYPGGLFKPNQGITRAEMAAILVKLFGSGESGSTASFKDVAAKFWASPAIAEAAKRGWMKGYPDGSFHPDAVLTRAEMASLLAALLPDGAAQGLNQPAFSDVSGHWGEAAIRAAQANGYLDGYADGTFRPDRTLTRAEAVTVLNRLLGREGNASGTPIYADVPAGHWAFGAIQAASAPADPQ